MRIVFFIDHLRPDGSQRALGQITKGLAQRGHQIAVVCLNDSWDLGTADALREDGIEVKIVGRRRLLGGYGIIELGWWLRARQFDCAVTFLFFSDVIGRLLARLVNIPRIVTSIRARNIHYRRWQLLLSKATMPFADVVVFNSANICQFAVEQEGAVAERSVVIPNGIESADSADLVSGASIRDELHIPISNILLGSIGRLTHQKGLDTLLSAIALVRHENITVLLAGVGEAEAALRTQARQLGIEQNVIFAGYRRDVPQVLASLHAYIHPARFEGMSNAVLEAMAAGCPIVATAIDGNRELIDDGVHGWLVPADDPVAMAQAITAVLADPGEAKKRGEAAKNRVREQFSISALVDQWEHIICMN